MRPTDAFGRSSRPSPDRDDASLGMSSFHSVTASQAMSYCVADEGAVDASLEHSLSAFGARPPQPRHQDYRKRDRPVPRSDPSEVPRSPSAVCHEPPHRATAASPVLQLHELLSQPRTPPPHKSPSRLYHAPPSLSSPSQPMTPMLGGASGPASIFSLSAESLSEDLGSVIAVSDFGDHDDLPEDEGLEDDESVIAAMENSGATAPQLVMPSIRMPSRRPFTDEGKAIGRLKILVAGEAGAGKTSLIKAIVQSCEHIVHVDPIGPVSAHHSKVASRARAARGTTGARAEAVSEIHASTKPYPDWWAELDEPGLQKWRNSFGGDAVINRNICFVDTVGFRAGSRQSLQDVLPVVEYVESHLERVVSNTLSDSDLFSLLSGDGGSAVDAVLYLISQDITGTDIQYLRKLAPLTNVLVLLAKSDTIPADNIWDRKQKILSQLLEAGVRVFDFSSRDTTQSSAVLSITSATGADSEVMDASLLMSPDYVEPLLPSELGVLVKQLFSADGASWLRHSAARKFLQWSSGEKAPRPQALYRPLQCWPPHAARSPAALSPMPAGQMISRDLIASPSPSAMALTPTVRREEQLAEFRIANWAADLQRSLESERTRYEALARGERVQDGTLVAVRGGRSRKHGGRSCGARGAGTPLVGNDAAGPRARAAGPARRRGPPVQQSLYSRDPLGLLQMAAEFRAKGWIVLEVLGSIGVLGGLALWASGKYFHVSQRDEMKGCLSYFGHGFEL